ncbi:HU family DNA-binding protein [Bacteroides heparinolyticus]|uniref:HU family DNA-binding protein n=1 Tax=Prevotella heparinolytica TaxID=28113 RepID=UPI0035A17E7D
MPVIYKSFQSVLATKKGKKLFYPRVVVTGNISTTQVAKEIAELSSLSTGDTKNVIDNLVTVMTRHLQASESVTLDGLGTFRLAMKSTMNGVEEAAKVSAAQSTLRVRFMPASKRKPDGTVATRSLLNGVKCVRFDFQDAPPKPDGNSPAEDSGSSENPSGGSSGGENQDVNPLG